MKKLIAAAALLGTSMMSNVANAGCSEWGTVNYVYHATSGVLAIIKGTACYVTSGDLTAIASVLSTAKANNVQGYLTQNGQVAIQYN